MSALPRFSDIDLFGFCARASSTSNASFHLERGGRALQPSEQTGVFSRHTAFS